MLNFDRLKLNWLCFNRLEYLKKNFWPHSTQACFFRPTQLKLSFFLSDLAKVKMNWTVFDPSVPCLERLGSKWLFWLTWLNENVFDRVRLKRALFWPVRHEMVTFWPNRLKQKLFVCVRPKCAKFCPTQSYLIKFWKTRLKQNCVWLSLTKVGSFSTDWTELVLFRSTRLNKNYFTLCSTQAC